MALNSFTISRRRAAALIGSGLAAIAISAPACAEAPPAPSPIAYGTDTKQFGELWLPRGPGPYPAIILVHGGAWRDRLDLSVMRPIAADLALHGFAVWNIEYRTLDDPGGGFPGTFLDVGAAADHLRELAKTFPLNLSRLIAVGHSAGGHLALWLAGRRRIASASPLYTADPLLVGGVVDLAGPPNLRTGLGLSNAAGGRGTIETLIGASVRGFDEGLKDTSPAELLPLGVPQVLIFGSEDKTMPPEQATIYQADAAAKGEKVEVVVVAGAHHGDVLSPRTRAGQESFRAIAAVYERARPAANGAKVN